MAYENNAFCWHGLISTDIEASKMAPPMDGIPSHWNNYLRVTDVDAGTKAAEANGGKVLNPPTDIPPGRFSVVASPSGAVVSLFHERDEASAENPAAGEGSIHWVELHSTDLKADLTWLEGAYGIKNETMAMPNGEYFILGDGHTGGAMTQMNPGAPAMWLMWIEVSDVDAAVKRISNNGGQILGEMMEVPNVGRFSVAQDPTGAVFGVITPAAKE